MYVEIAIGGSTSSIFYTFVPSQIIEIIYSDKHELKNA